MATPNEIAELRGLIQEPSNEDPWTDEYLGGLIDRYGIDRSAKSIWKQKAAGYVEIVNISEGGSSRSNSDIHKHALEMIDVFGDDGSGSASGGSRTRRIVRG